MRQLQAPLQNLCLGDSDTALVREAPTSLNEEKQYYEFPHVPMPLGGSGTAMQCRGAGPQGELLGVSGFVLGRARPSPPTPTPPSFPLPPAPGDTAVCVVRCRIVAGGGTRCRGWRGGGCRRGGGRGGLDVPNGLLEQKLCGAFPKQLLGVVTVQAWCVVLCAATQVHASLHRCLFQKPAVMREMHACILDVTPRVTGHVRMWVQICTVVRHQPNDCIGASPDASA
jgi:hypothetical protein